MVCSKIVNISRSMKIVQARITVLILYMIAAGITIIISSTISFSNLWIKLLFLDIILTIFIYILSCFLKNASLYDPYWSIIPPFFLVFWIVETGSTFSVGSDISFRIIALLILVSLWAIRLSYNWIRGWKGFNHEDWRYRNLREKTKSMFWLVNLIGIQLLPTLVVFSGCLGLGVIILAGQKQLNFIDIIGFSIVFLSILLETVADEQMRKFHKKISDNSNIIEYGLWGRSRHPNYLGEIGFWWGIAIIAIGSVQNPLSYIWLFIGPFSVTLLFLFISIPLMEKRQKKRRPNYIEYMKKTPVLFPRLKQAFRK